jgi:hypothetical protein
MKAVKQVDIGFFDGCSKVFAQALNVDSTHLILFDLIGLLLLKP